MKPIFCLFLLLGVLASCSDPTPDNQTPAPHSDLRSNQTVASFRPQMELADSLAAFSFLLWPEDITQAEMKRVIRGVTQASLRYNDIYDSREDLYQQKNMLDAKMRYIRGKDLPKIAAQLGCWATLQEVASEGNGDDDSGDDDGDDDGWDDDWDDLFAAVAETQKEYLCLDPQPSSEEEAPEAAVWFQPEVETVGEQPSIACSKLGQEYPYRSEALAEKCTEMIWANRQEVKALNAPLQKKHEVLNQLLNQHAEKELQKILDTMVNILEPGVKERSIEERINEKHFYKNYVFTDASASDITYQKSQESDQTQVVIKLAMMFDSKMEGQAQDSQKELIYTTEETTQRPASIVDVQESMVDNSPTLKFRILEKRSFSIAGEGNTAEEFTGRYYLADLIRIDRAWGVIHLGKVKLYNASGELLRTGMMKAIKMKVTTQEEAKQQLEREERERESDNR